MTTSTGLLLPVLMDAKSDQTGLLQQSLYTGHQGKHLTHTQQSAPVKLLQDQEHFPQYLIGLEADLMLENPQKRTLNGPRSLPGHFPSPCSVKI